MNNNTENSSINFKNGYSSSPPGETSTCDLIKVCRASKFWLWSRGSIRAAPIPCGVRRDLALESDDIAAEPRRHRKGGKMQTTASYITQ